jgi:hypothetical protein
LEDAQVVPGLLDVRTHNPRIHVFHLFFSFTSFEFFWSMLTLNDKSYPLFRFLSTLTFFSLILRSCIRKHRPAVWWSVYFIVRNMFIHSLTQLMFYIADHQIATKMSYCIFSDIGMFQEWNRLTNVITLNKKKKHIKKTIHIMCFILIKILLSCIIKGTPLRFFWHVGTGNNCLRLLLHML